MQETRETAETPALLKVGEAAARCRVSRPTMYRLVSRGVVPAVRVGLGRGPIRIPADELEAWLFSDVGGESTPLDPSMTSGAIASLTIPAERLSGTSTSVTRQSSPVAHAGKKAGA